RHTSPELRECYGARRRSIAHEIGSPERLECRRASPTHQARTPPSTVDQPPASEACLQIPLDSREKTTAKIAAVHRHRGLVPTTSAGIARVGTPSVAISAHRVERSSRPLPWPSHLELTIASNLSSRVYRLDLRLSASRPVRPPPNWPLQP